MNKRKKKEQKDNIVIQKKNNIKDIMTRVIFQKYTTNIMYLYIKRYNNINIIK